VRSGLRGRYKPVGLDVAISPPRRGDGHRRSGGADAEGNVYGAEVGPRMLRDEYVRR